MIATSTAADLEDAVLAVAHQVLPGFAFYEGLDRRGYLVRVATGKTYAHRAIAASFVDDEPGAGVRVDVTTGNGVVLAEVRVLANVPVTALPAIIEAAWASAQG